MPQCDAGMRIEPPWSPPIAMSTSPAATSAPHPLDEPPEVRRSSCGLRTGPEAEVWLPADRHMFSQTALPMISPPAARIRRTTVASSSAT
jgi:hypothetical protein